MDAELALGCLFLSKVQLSAELIKRSPFIACLQGPVHRAALAWPLGLLCAVSILHGSVCREIKTELLDLYCGVHFRVLHEFNWHEHN